MADSKTSTLERVLLVLVLAVSLFLRLTALDTFITSDEHDWRSASIEFGRALSAGEWQLTHQTVYPGVVTMYLGATAERLPWLGQPWPWDDTLRPLMRNQEPAPGTGVPPLTLGARRLLAVVTWLGALLLYPLLRRLFRARVALAATVLVALDPFLLAHSRVHHADALLATFVMLSAASLLVYELRGRRTGYLVLSAAMAALAAANKTPGILLAPWAGVVLLGPALRAPKERRRQALWQGVKALALWGVGAAAAYVAIWPAMWVQPLRTLANVIELAREYARTPHINSNYLLGVINPDPGLPFYPVTWAFRSSPLTWVGLAGLMLAWRSRQQSRAPLVLLLSFVLLFAAAMTVGAKKGDRYLLPDFPLLDVPAAVGCVALGRWLLDRVPATLRAHAPGVLLAGVAVAQFALVWPTRPYYLSYYNPIVGGSKTAPRALVVGWGEGLDLAAAYLNRKPHAENLVVWCWRQSEFSTFFRGHTMEYTERQCPGQPDYYVLYQNVVQRDLVSDMWKPLVATTAPEYVVRLNGIEYAWVYRNTLYQEAERQVVDYILARADPERDVIVLDGEGRLARNYNGPVPMTELVVGKREDNVRTTLQEVAAGHRRLWYFAYPGDECDTNQLRKQLELGAKAVDKVEVDGVRAVCYELGAEAGFVPSRPGVLIGARFASITLLGCDVEALVPGKAARVRLYWQTSAPVSEDYTVFVQLFGPGGEMRGQADGMPQGGTLPTSAWRVGPVIADDHIVEVPADAPVGEYYLLLGLYDAGSMARVQAVDAAGQRLADDAVRVSDLHVPAR